ncbi:MAG: RpiB/LacA/LacB family sugar-phosphate isomerase [Patescibacteria group bacterium]|nr:RpiB/LacA/LacB family sugar-phosphate isomerase [Patescibacteria group bacterium]MCX7589361.1 RpiB/LacA/LacB family sugar-phosphate isomerase [Patescibacteria group bacterium]MDW8279896.1 RpiB/LacA/LacB family sugar-phosphate isomerase [bacterium]
MTIYLGADHRGFKLKEKIKIWLKEIGYDVFDCGAENLNSEDDYPDFAKLVVKNVLRNIETSRGILFCGSGVGVCMAANRFKRIRAGLAINSDQVFEARKNDDINILCIAADFILEDEAQKIIKVFLITPFEHKEKHFRRIEKLDQLN